MVGVQYAISMTVCEERRVGAFSYKSAFLAQKPTLDN